MHDNGMDNEAILPRRTVTPFEDEGVMKDVPCPHCNEPKCVAWSGFESMLDGAVAVAKLKETQGGEEETDHLPGTFGFGQCVFDELGHTIEEYVILNRSTNENSWDGTKQFCYCLEKCKESVISKIWPRFCCPSCQQTPCLAYKYGYVMFTQPLKWSYDVGGIRARDLYITSIKTFWHLCECDGIAEQYEHLPFCVQRMARRLLLNSNTYQANRQNLRMEDPGFLLSA